jgi:hypothetical protein
MVNVTRQHPIGLGSSCATTNNKPAFNFLVANAGALSATNVALSGTDVFAFFVGEMLTSTTSFGGAVVYARTFSDTPKQGFSCALGPCLSHCRARLRRVRRARAMP